MRELLLEWLAGAGYRVQAAAHVAQYGGPAALVIVSMYMPKNGGAQLVREVQAAHPGTPLIAVSGQVRAGLSTNGGTAQMPGVHKVIAKPLAREDLLDAVRTMIGAPASHRATN